MTKKLKPNTNPVEPNIQKCSSCNSEQRLREKLKDLRNSNLELPNPFNQPPNPLDPYKPKQDENPLEEVEKNRYNSLEASEQYQKFAKLINSDNPALIKKGIDGLEIACEMYQTLKKTHNAAYPAEVLVDACIRLEQYTRAVPYAEFAKEHLTDLDEPLFTRCHNNCSILEEKLNIEL